jgi:pimeloyl-ACP methyl ester carboxylesterase
VRGVRPIYAFNYPWWDSIPNNSARLERFVERVASEAKQVRLVGHSMGGLVALDYVLHRAPSSRVACCVTLGTPHAGVIFRGPLLGAAGRDLRAQSHFLRERAQCAIAVPCLSIASEHDNIVFPAKRAALSARGGLDLVVDQRAHFGILFDSAIADRVAAFLASPERLQNGAVAPETTA